MDSEDPNKKSWMAVELSLNDELKLEHSIRQISQHSEIDKVRKLACSLMRQNAHQQMLLEAAIGHIGHLEMALFLGATAGPDEIMDFSAMARDICDEFGIG